MIFVFLILHEFTTLAHFFGISRKLGGGVMSAKLFPPQKKTGRRQGKNGQVKMCVGRRRLNSRSTQQRPPPHTQNPCILEIPTIGFQKVITLPSKRICGADLLFGEFHKITLTLWRVPQNLSSPTSHPTSTDVCGLCVVCV